MAEIDPKRYQLAFILTAVAVVIYLCTLAIAYFGDKNAKRRYPPWLSPCPDYWSVTTDANNQTVCCRTVDKNGQGNGNPKSSSDTDAQYSYGATGNGERTCVPLDSMTWEQKCQWANKNHIHVVCRVSVKDSLPKIGPQSLQIASHETQTKIRIVGGRRHWRQDKVLEVSHG